MDFFFDIVTGSSVNELPLTYPLVYKLLQMVHSCKNIYYFEIRDLRQWTGIGNDAYSLNEIDSYFQHTDLSEKVNNFVFLILQFFLI